MEDEGRRIGTDLNAHLQLWWGTVQSVVSVNNLRKAKAWQMRKNAVVVSRGARNTVSFSGNQPDVICTPSNNNKYAVPTAPRVVIP